MDTTAGGRGSRARTGTAAAAPAAPRLGLAPALGGLAGCAWRAAGLVARRRLHHPPGAVGTVLRFADGTRARVYRETVVERSPAADPAVLVVAFRLRHVRGDGAHALFRLESVLNTVLFVGFPGFVSKLWLGHDERGRYRGLYEWDGADRASRYAQALWWPLALVCEPRSIRYVVLPGLRRDEVLGDPALTREVASPLPGDWWRLDGHGAGAPRG